MPLYRLTFVLALLAALGAARIASARDDADDRRAKVRERVRALRAAKLIEWLELDERIAAKLFPILNKYDDQIEPLLIDNGKARRELREMAESGKVDDAKVNKLIDRILANRAKIQQLEADRLREARKMLTPIQAAKLVVVLPEIDRLIEREIRKAAKKRGGRGRRRGGGAGAGAEPDFGED